MDADLAPLTGRDQRALRRGNLSAVLRLIERHGTISRRDLARLSGLTPPAITHIVGELARRGIVVEVGSVPSNGPHGGRPRRLLGLADDTCYALAVHLGVHGAEVALTDIRGRIVARRRPRRAEVDSPTARLAHACTAADDLLRESGVSRHQVVGVGIGAVGQVDPIAGVDRVVPSLGWRDVPIRALVAERLDLPVYVDDHVRAMALAESWFGVARRARNVALVWVGTTIGVGLVSDDRLHHGATHGAGQLGHVIVDPDGELCSCGRRGCLDTVASGASMLRQARALGYSHLTAIQDLLDALEDGHPDLHAIVEAGSRQLGIAVANLKTLFDPDLIVLAGNVWFARETMYPAIVETVRQYTPSWSHAETPLVLSELGADLPLVGAASLALRAFFMDPEEFIARSLPPRTDALRTG